MKVFFPLYDDVAVVSGFFFIRDFCCVCTGQWWSCLLDLSFPFILEALLGQSIYLLAKFRKFGRSIKIVPTQTCLYFHS